MTTFLQERQEKDCRINSSNDKSEEEFDINNRENGMELNEFWLQMREKGIG